MRGKWQLWPSKSRREKKLYYKNSNSSSNSKEPAETTIWNFKEPILNKNLPRAGFLHVGTITSLNLWFFVEEQKRRKEIKKRKKVQVERETVLMSFCLCDKALSPEAPWGGEGSLQAYTQQSHSPSRKEVKAGPQVKAMEDGGHCLLNHSQLMLSYLSRATQTQLPKEDVARIRLGPETSIINQDRLSHGCCPP